MSVSPLLELDAVHFGYRGRPVISGVSLALAAGEIFALLGPNGSGKSTLAKLITGRYAAERGSLRLLGRDLVRRRREIGLAPQEIGLYPHLTARENVATFARLAGVARTAVRPATDAALQGVELKHRGDAPVAQLSGGYQRRANLAAAIAHEPALLVLDESTAGVDLEAREAIEQLIRERARLGAGVLLITHDLEQAQRLADRVGFLLDGRLEPQGAPHQLLQQAYGDSRILSVELAAPPDARQRQSLQSLGLEPVDDERWWTGPARENDARLESPHRLLEHAGVLEHTGVTVQAVCVQRPSLSTLFQRLTRKALA